MNVKLSCIEFRSLWKWNAIFLRSNCNCIRECLHDKKLWWIQWWKQTKEALWNEFMSREISLITSDDSFSYGAGPPRHFGVHSMQLRWWSFFLRNASYCSQEHMKREMLGEFSVLIFQLGDCGGVYWRWEGIVGGYFDYFSLVLVFKTICFIWI